jgi:maltooligosyltrehalose synthase
MPAPSTGDLAFLFQTIVGAWPLDLRLEDRSGMAAFSRRLSDWQQKALREAKLVSDWLSPNHAYEAAAAGFISRLFDPRTELLPNIFAFVQRIAAAGAVNSLAQVLVKLTAPGVPDIYQGTEYWDFSLVDPDNRRPVDFDRRQASLWKKEWPPVADNWANGDIKQALIARALAARKKHPDLFAHGDYLPCKVSGALADCIGAFARRSGTATAITIFSRATRLLIGSGSLIAPSKEWKDAHILSPPELSEALFSDALSDRKNGYSGTKLSIRDILSVSPVALLISA